MRLRREVFVRVRTRMFSQLTNVLHRTQVIPLKYDPSAQDDLQVVPSELAVYPAAQETLHDPDTQVAEVTPVPVAEHLFPAEPQLKS